MTGCDYVRGSLGLMSSDLGSSTRIPVPWNLRRGCSEGPRNKRCSSSLADSTAAGLCKSLGHECLCAAATLLVINFYNRKTKTFQVYSHAYQLNSWDDVAQLLNEPLNALLRFSESRLQYLPTGPCHILVTLPSQRVRQI